MVASWHAPPTQTLLQTKYTPLRQQLSPAAVANPSRTMCPASPQKLNSGHRAGLQIPQIPVRSSICRTSLNKSHPWMPRCGPGSDPLRHEHRTSGTFLFCMPTRPWCRILWVLWVMSWTSMDWDCSGMSQKTCSVRLGSVRLGWSLLLYLACKRSLMVDSYQVTPTWML